MTKLLTRVVTLDISLRTMDDIEKYGLFSPAVSALGFRGPSAAEHTCGVSRPLSVCSRQCPVMR